MEGNSAISIDLCTTFATKKINLRKITMSRRRKKKIRKKKVRRRKERKSREVKRRKSYPGSNNSTTSLTTFGRNPIPQTPTKNFLQNPNN